MTLKRECSQQSELKRASRQPVFISMAGIIAAVLMVVSAGWAQTPGTWAYTGPVASAATGPASVLMQNGKVLVAGGNLGGIGVAQNQAQLYDPASNAFTATKNMRQSRWGLSGTALNDGRVLIVGGSNGTYGAGWFLTILKTAELYDPAAGTFTLAAGRMATPRAGQTATLLPDGRVLVTGGMNQYNIRIRWGTCTNKAEIYDPATDSFSSAGVMSTARCGHTATLLRSGKVLVVGGTNAELYDPASNTWVLTGSPSSAHSGHSAVVLGDGRVLVAGPQTAAEIYDPASGTWSSTGSTTNTYGPNSAVVLQNGKVLLVGGPAGQCELYDPASGAWTATGSLQTTRFGFGLNVLGNGKVLVTDGSVSYQIMSAELYTP